MDRSLSPLAASFVNDKNGRFAPASDEDVDVPARQGQGIDDGDELFLHSALFVTVLHSGSMPILRANVHNTFASIRGPGRHQPAGCQQRFFCSFLGPESGRVRQCANRGVIVRAYERRSSP